MYVLLRLSACGWTGGSAVAESVGMAVGSSFGSSSDGGFNRSFGWTRPLTRFLELSSQRHLSRSILQHVISIILIHFILFHHIVCICHIRTGTVSLNPVKMVQLPGHSDVILVFSQIALVDGFLHLT